MAMLRVLNTRLGLRARSPWCSVASSRSLATPLLTDVPHDVVLTGLTEYEPVRAERTEQPPVLLGFAGQRECWHVALDDPSAVPGKNPERLDVGVVRFAIAVRRREHDFPRVVMLWIECHPAVYVRHILPDRMTLVAVHPTLTLLEIDRVAPAGSSARWHGCTCESPGPPGRPTSTPARKAGTESCRPSGELAAAGVVAPDLVGEEMGAGVPVDFAWSAPKVAVLIAPNATDQADIQAEGWTVVQPDLNAIKAALAAEEK